jgi:hypothetical protein
MATIATRLTNGGTLLVNGAIDEVTQTTVNTKPDTVLAVLFDEVSNSGSSVASRVGANGTVQVSGIFDEFTGAPVVDANLKIWFDAGQTTSYPSTGTTWTDLSGNGINATLTNSPVYSGTPNGGDLRFNGSTQSGTTSSPNISISGYTIICWIYSAANQNSFTGIFLHRSGLNAYGIGCSYGTPVTNQLGYTWASDATTYNYNSGLIIPNNRWSMVAISANLSSATLYLNTSSATRSHTEPSFTLGAVSIANDTSSGGRFFNGRVSTAMYYNRALTTDEIQQNFNALRRRYNI